MFQKAYSRAFNTTFSHKPLTRITSRTMDGIELLSFLRARPYLLELIEGNRKWLTSVIHLKILGFKPLMAVMIRVPFLRSTCLKIDWECRERVVENASVYESLDKVPDRATLLDIGCAESSVPFELASMGYQVTGLDLRRYPLHHPNLTFVLGNIFAMPFLSGSFDFVSAISTVEHLGIETWGIPSSQKTDVDGISEIHRCLKDKGLLYLTVPFGKKDLTWQRIYDRASLRQLLTGFNVTLSKYYTRINKQYWIQVPEDAMRDIVSTIETGVNGVAIMLCQKGPV